MNAWEAQCAEDMRRANARERRRRVSFTVLASAALVGGVAWDLSRGITWDVIGRLGWLFGVPLVTLPAAALLLRLRKRWEDRATVDTTTERERLHRDAPAALAPRPRPLRVALASAGLVVLSLVTAVWKAGWLADSVRGQIVLGACIVALSFAFRYGSRAYATWRTRRNARLAARCDAWLASADSCKIGAREWTK